MKKAPYIVKNKKAFFDYEILETWEAGIDLNGHEVKSIRAWQVNLKWSYISGISWSLYLKGASITPWKALPNTSHIVSERERKVFLHKKTIDYLQTKSKEGSYAILALEIYLKGSLIKVKVALAKWKKLYEKKESLKRKTIDKDIRRAMSKNY